MLDTIKRRAFISFDYDDAWCVQQVRNMGAVDGNRLVRPNALEEVKSSRDAAIRRWIDEQMRGKSVVIVLIGEDTHKSEWVKYEIRKGWELHKGLLGIHIHGLKDRHGQTARKGKSPFDGVYVSAVPKMPDNFRASFGKDAMSKALWCRMNIGDSSDEKPNCLAAAMAERPPEGEGGAMTSALAAGILLGEMKTGASADKKLGGAAAALMAGVGPSVLPRELRSPTPAFPSLVCLGDILRPHDPKPSDASRQSALAAEMFREQTPNAFIAASHFVNSGSAVYNAIKENLADWIEDAIEIRGRYA